MLTLFSCGMLACATLIIFVANRPTAKREPEYTGNVLGVICIIALIAGCAVRFAWLDNLPEGISAEEALVGIQAKMLWETGGFWPAGGLTTQFSQWNGESAGPLLAALTAPFVGILGFTQLAVRIPLVLLSVFACFAAYGLGCELGGKNAGRWMLIIYALSPYFVLASRLTTSANAAVFLLPIALYLLVLGMKKAKYLYLGMICVALLTYAQDLYFFISPVVILVSGMTTVAFGGNKKHAVFSMILGLVVSVPAMLTLYVNLKHLNGYNLLGIVEIPSLEAFDKDVFLYRGMTIHDDWVFPTLNKLWAVLVGGVFQSVMHENINSALYLPSGFLAFTVISLPLIILGAGTIMLGKAKTEVTQQGKSILVAMVSVVVLICEVLFGSQGVINLGGETSLYDHSALFLFSALLMTSGWKEMTRRSVWGIRLLGGMYAVCFVMLCIHLFGGAYQENATTYFTGFVNASVRAEQLQEETDAKVKITSNVYPHIQPEAAAELMYLYAIGDPLKDKDTYEVFYAAGEQNAEEEYIYLLHCKDISMWDYEGFEYEEFGDYVVLHSAQVM